MLINLVVTFAVCAGMVAAYYHLSQRGDALIHRCCNRNCLDTGRLVQSDYDEAAGVWDCTYAYSYKGRSYTHKKFFFHEEPPEELLLYWRPNSPTDAFTEGDVVGKSIPVTESLTKILIVGAVGAGLSLILSPLSAMFIVLGVCIWKLGMRLLSVPMFVLSVFCFFLFASANFDPLAYSEVSWEMKEYPNVSYKMSVIDTLSPEEIDRLYYDWHWLNEDIKMGHLGRKTPIFGVYTNKHWMEMDEIPWPAEWVRWLDVDYRNSMLEDDNT